MKIAKIKNEADYDRTFFGIDVNLEAEDDRVLEREVYDILIKNCPNFQDLTNPPANGGDPRIRVYGSTDEGDVRIDASGMKEDTKFTAPSVKLEAESVTGVPEHLYDKLQNDNRYKSLEKAGEVKFVEWDEK